MTALPEEHGDQVCRICGEGLPMSVSLPEQAAHYCTQPSVVVSSPWGLVQTLITQLSVIGET